jgi:hypothetical protein
VRSQKTVFFLIIIGWVGKKAFPTGFYQFSLKKVNLMPSFAQPK